MLQHGVNEYVKASFPFRVRHSELVSESITCQRDAEINYSLWFPMLGTGSELVQHDYRKQLA